MKRFVFAVLLVGLVTVLLLFARLFKKEPLKEPASRTNPPQEERESAGEIPSISFSLSSEYSIHVFAKGLGNPRDLQFSPEGTLLVSDPVNNTVSVLPDEDGDGVADENKIIISSGNKVHGLAFFKNQLFVAEVNRVALYSWNGVKKEAAFVKQLFRLPSNSDHNNRGIVINGQGDVYVSLGSTCNVCVEPVERGGSVIVSDINGNSPHVWTHGLRNAAFMTINPTTGQIWGTEMGRDYLGDDTPPDEINILEGNKDYGWPNCYGNKTPDLSFTKKADCKDTVAPIFEIPAHSAPLGLAFINSSQFSADWQGDLLVSYHGSWNRSHAIGYKIVHLKVKGNTIAGSDDFLTGFNPGNQKDDSLGRPVDVVFDKKGNLYVSDDKAGVVYIIQKKD